MGGGVRRIIQRSINQKLRGSRAKHVSLAQPASSPQHDHHQRLVSERAPTSTHRPIHTGTSPQFSGTQ
jgi:hypothetical protein